MKINRLILLLLIMVAIAVVNTILGITNMKQERDQRDLSSQLAQLRPILQVAKEDFNDLEQRLAAAQAQLAKEQASFPSQLSNSEVVERVFQTAQKSQVKDFLLRANPVSAEKIGGHTYNVLRIEVTAKGSISQVASFIRRLEEETFKTLILDRVGITISSEEGIVSLNLAVYAHPLPDAITSGSN